MYKKKIIDLTLGDLQELTDIEISLSKVILNRASLKIYLNDIEMESDEFDMSEKSISDILNEMSDELSQKLQLIAKESD